MCDHCAEDALSAGVFCTDMGAFIRAKAAERKSWKVVSKKKKSKRM
jgi:hypothetical protein